MTKEELKTKIISAISLGCDKNRVDLEKMLGMLKEYGFTITDEVENADIVIVNTCAFIEPAQREAIMNIIYVEDLKKRGQIEKVIVSGCLPERNYDEICENFPLIDKFMHLRENPNIISIIEEMYGVANSKPIKTIRRVITNSPSYAYLKIADGCSNACSYCTIPRIRGRYRSYPIEDLVQEAKMLVTGGAKEIVLVAQDITRYGEELYGENCLIKLCDKLSKIKDLQWIRLHYLYPEKLDDTLLDYIAKNDKICKYIDLPLQHIDNDILKSMRRKLDEYATRKLVKKIKEQYPSLAFRTTFIVGYPGETRAKFKKLYDFVKESKFDYAGFFPYSREAGTASYYMKNQISSFTKRRRLKKLQKLQNGIVTSLAREKIGQVITVLVDSFDSDSGEFIAHSQNLSPSVDFGVRFVDNGNIKCQTFVNVKITDFDGSYFKGELE